MEKEEEGKKEDVQVETEEGVQEEEEEEKMLRRLFDGTKQNGFSTKINERV